MIRISDLFVLCKKTIRPRQDQLQAREHYEIVTRKEGGEDGAPVSRSAESKKEEKKKGVTI
jgi:hypothetical protein